MTLLHQVICCFADTVAMMSIWNVWCKDQNGKGIWGKKWTESGKNWFHRALLLLIYLSRVLCKAFLHYRVFESWYVNVVVCIFLITLPSHLSANHLKPTTVRPLSPVEKGKVSIHLRVNWFCRSRRYLWTPAPISCDGNMTLGRGRIMDMLTFTPFPAP